MLYASAAFLFLFLPLALGIYMLVSERAKKYVLLSTGLLFYVLANLASPPAIPVFGAVLALTCLAGWVVARTGSRVVPLCVAVFDIAAFVVLRVLYEAPGVNFMFPLGAAIYIFASVSYLFDIRRGDCRPGSLIDTLLFLSFFPVIVAGPVVKYKDFAKYIGEAKVSIFSFAGGARLFMTGFIETVAVAGVTGEAYKTIIELSGHSINIVLGILAAALALLSAFFTIAGWTDMGAGISMMFGIMIPRDCGFAPGALTPLGHFNRIFRGLSGWLDDYLIFPLSRVLKLRGKPAESLGVFLQVVLMSLWIRTTPAMLIAASVVACAAALLKLTRADEAIEQKRYLRPLGWLLTTVIMSVFWSAATLGGADELVSLFGKLNLAEDFRTYYIYISLSGWEFISVAAAALLVVAPLSFYHDSILSLMPKKFRTSLEALFMLVLLFVFVFCVLYFMPQYPQYAVRVSDYFVF
ncbi:MAG: hypothetical protein GX057_03165 [Clostridiales bacterium]|nr:hypothetical protein [Clostridiales bacterium]